MSKRTAEALGLGGYADSDDSGDDDSLDGSSNGGKDAVGREDL
jgi:hypothetical protein